MLSYDESLADTACKLECVEKFGQVHEFVGPVKIVLMDTPKEVYTKKVCVSAFIGLANLLMGVTVMTVLFYTLAFKTPLMMNLHIVLCTIGYQLFIPSGILMINSLHGPSAPLKKEDRNFQHLFLQIFGISCAVVGSVLIMIFDPGTFKSKLTSHAMIGLIGGGLSALAALTGPFAYFSKDTGTCGRIGKCTHAFFGVSGFSASSVSFALGLFFSKSFKEWSKFLPDLLYILMGLCAIYTLIIVIVPFVKNNGKPL